MSIGWWSPFCTPFTEAVVRRRVQRVPGVYVLFEKVKDKGWVFRSLGQAEDLRERLLPLTTDAGAGVERGFSWMEISTEGERTGVERFLSLSLGSIPGVDPAGGDGEPIRVALPPLPAQPTPSPTL